MGGRCSPGILDGHLLGQNIRIIWAKSLIIIKIGSLGHYSPPPPLLPNTSKYVYEHRHTFSGYKIDVAHVPIQLQSYMYQCTSTYSTTESGKRIRLRFLACSDIPEEEFTVIEDILSSFVAFFNRAISFRVTAMMHQRDLLVKGFGETSLHVDR